ncbi:MAG: hypothetical protein Q8Q58_05645 [Candidatus Rokubacteria bacterium]|nr:hypothetical protein [Candidatus Rokubacteria bacterium]
MRIVMPSTTYRAHDVRLAARPASLRGRTVGFLDGWGRRESDGSFAMYPLMEELKRLLAERHGTGETIWIRKPNISKPAPKEQITELVTRADVIVNGEAA